ncbi:hypothetical protein K438DRAFT_1860028 [Mycena galopus ATCC 62051]|nr:hypothetical protein K438DRAFT_1860028 [Mycena galopus ATCC 62051]
MYRESHCAPASIFMNSRSPFVLAVVHVITPFTNLHRSSSTLMLACFEAVSRFKNLQDLVCHTRRGLVLELPALRVHALPSLMFLHIHTAHFMLSSQAPPPSSIEHFSYTEWSSLSPAKAPRRIFSIQRLSAASTFGRNRCSPSSTSSRTKSHWLHSTTSTASTSRSRKPLSPSSTLAYRPSRLSVSWASTSVGPAPCAIYLPQRRRLSHPISRPRRSPPPHPPRIPSGDVRGRLYPVSKAWCI